MKAQLPVSIPKGRIVIKLGTNVVIDDAGHFAGERLSAVARSARALMDVGFFPVIVSSGAIGLGRENMSLKDKKLKTAERQALAAIGQSRLMGHYQKLFADEKLKIAQILLTREDLADRQRYLSVRQTLDQLVEWKIVPILNENDSVSDLELKETSGGFGDNDKLSALVAAKMDAQLLVLLSDVDGLYDKNPKTYKDAQLVSVVENSEQLKKYEVSGLSNRGRGGMQSKLDAARVAAWSGIPVLISSGTNISSLAEITRAIVDNKPCAHGTWILPKKKLANKKHWIGFSSGVFGIVRVNAGAAKALTSENKSLLPIGVTDVEGEFQRNQVVAVVDETGREIGRGLCYFSAKELKTIQGLKTSEAMKKVDDPIDDVVIQRDHYISLIDDAGDAAKGGT